jgi:hypothetical protein
MAQVPHPSGAGLPTLRCRSDFSFRTCAIGKHRSHIRGAGPIYKKGPAPGSHRTCASNGGTDVMQWRDLRQQWRDLRHTGVPQQRRHCTEDCRTEGHSTDGRCSCASRQGPDESNGGTCAIRERCSAEGQRPGCAHRIGGQRRAAAHKNRGQRPGRVHRNGGQRRAAAHRNGRAAAHRNGGQRPGCVHRNGGQRRAAAHRNGGLQHSGPRRPLRAAMGR